MGEKCVGVGLFIITSWNKKKIMIVISRPFVASRRLNSPPGMEREEYERIPGRASEMTGWLTIALSIRNKRV